MTVQLRDPFHLEVLLAEVRAERELHLAHRGRLELRDGTGPDSLPLIMFDGVQPASELDATAAEWRRVGSPLGFITWRDVVMQRTLQVAAAPDEGRLRAGLIALATVALEWVEAIDDRKPVRS